MGCMVCEGEQVALPRGWSQHYSLILLCLFPRLKLEQVTESSHHPGPCFLLGDPLPQEDTALTRMRALQILSMSFPLPGGCEVAVKHEAEREK